VLRDGKVQEVPVDRLVPGDVVELKAGDIVPGDCRLIAVRDLFVNQGPAHR
jgi:Mg2+-importing ATPase